MPYIYGNYKNSLNAFEKSGEIIDKVKNFFDAELYTYEERRLLLKEVIPYVEKLDEGIIKWSKRMIEAPDSERKREAQSYIDQLVITTKELQKLKSILKNELELLYSIYLKAENTEISDLPKGESEKIRDIIFNIGSSLMKYPRVHESKDEESIRDIFLVALSGRFSDSTSTGETYNFKGKTDILVKNSSDINLLIVECKIWKGEEYLHQSIDQVLGRYVSSNDKEISILFFVKNKNFESIILKAVTSLMKADSVVSVNHDKRNFGVIRTRMRSYRDSSIILNSDFVFLHLLS